MKILKRVFEEYHYLRQKDWSFTEIGKFWDKTVDYDKINKKTYAYFRRFTDAFRICKVPDKSYVLDICSRTGQGTLFFWQKDKIRKVVCADVADKMQKICAKQLSKAGIDFQTKLFNNLPLPFPDKEFEAIFCFETIEHFPRPDQLIKEIARVARNGAEIIITTPNVLWEPIHSIAAILNIHHSEGPHQFIHKRKLRRFIKEAGLSIVKEETTILIPAGPKFLIKFGEWFEKKFKNSLMPHLGLRRIFICIRSTGYKHK